MRMTDISPFPFMELPLDIRRNVYRIAFEAEHDASRKHQVLDLGLLYTNREVHEEGLDTLWKMHLFVHVRTNLSKWENIEHCFWQRRYPWIRCPRFVQQKDFFDKAVAEIGVYNEDPRWGRGMQNENMKSFFIAIRPEDKFDEFCRFIANSSSAPTGLPELRDGVVLQVVVKDPSATLYHPERRAYNHLVVKTLCDSIKKHWWGYRKFSITGVIDEGIAQDLMRTVRANRWAGPTECLQELQSVLDRGHALHIAQNRANVPEYTQLLLDLRKQYHDALHLFHVVWVTDQYPELEAAGQPNFINRLVLIGLNLVVSSTRVCFKLAFLTPGNRSRVHRFTQEMMWIIPTGLALTNSIQVHPRWKRTLYLWEARAYRLRMRDNMALNYRMAKAILYTGFRNAPPGPHVQEMLAEWNLVESIWEAHQATLVTDAESGVVVADIDA